MLDWLLGEDNGNKNTYNNGRFNPISDTTDWLSGVFGGGNNNYQNYQQTLQGNNVDSYSDQYMANWEGPGSQTSNNGGIFNGLLSNDDGSMNWKGIGSAVDAVTGIFGGIANWNAMKDNRKMINNNIKFGKANLFNKGTSINNQMDAHQTMFNQNNPNMTNNPYENMTRMKTDTKQVA